MPYDTSARRTPEVENPRNPYREIQMNIGKVLEDALQNPVLNPGFSRPMVSRIIRGRAKRIPTEWPTIDIRYVRSDKAEIRNPGLNGVSITYKIYAEVRYMHSSIANANDDDVVRNLWKVRRVLEFNNDLHGLCPSLRSQIVEEDGEERFYIEFGEWIAGGRFLIFAPITLENVNFWDGNNVMDMAFPTGPRH